MKDLNNIPTGSTSSRDSTSQSLIRKLKLKKPDAWQRMAELYAPLVFHWCRQAKLQPADADDIVQEVFRTVDQKIDSFRHDSVDSTFGGWLRIITRNKLGDFFRRQNKSAQQLDDDDSRLERGAAMSQTADDELVSDEYGALYQRAMSFIQTDFKPSSWKAFWKVVIEERTVADVAAELSISPNAVYVAKSRILSRLREELGDI